MFEFKDLMVSKQKDQNIDRARRNGFKLKDVRLRLNIKKSICNRDGETLE